MEMLDDVASLCRFIFIRRLATSRRCSIGLRFRLPLLYAIMPILRVNSFQAAYAR